jgi:hypothetical protein
MSNDLQTVTYLLARRFYAEAAYFGTLQALRTGDARAHLMAGIGCCGCAAPLADAQRLLEGVPERAQASSCGLRVSPMTSLPFEGFFHMLQACRLDPAITVPADLREIADEVADDLAFVSRRELHWPPDRPRRYSHRLACVAAAVLLRDMTGSKGGLPGVMSPTLNAAREIIAAELGQTGGDALFLEVAREPS